MEEHRTAAPGRCARGADRDRSPAAPGTPGSAPAGPSTAAADPRPARPSSVDLVGPGVPLAPASRSGIGRLAHMRGNPGRGQPLGHIPPPGTPLHGERDVPRPANRTSQARRCTRSAGAIWPRSTSPLTVPGIVEGQLLPVDIQPAYDGIRTSSTSEGAHAPMPNAYAVKRDPRLSWGGFQHRPATSVRPDACHLMRDATVHHRLWLGGRRSGCYALRHQLVP